VTFQIWRRYRAEAGAGGTTKSRLSKLQICATPAEVTDEAGTGVDFNLAR
jgi:hypothetical protein